jgi:tetratricopeptide (TPR) repeat protein
LGNSSRNRLLPLAGVCAVLIIATIAAFWGVRTSGFVKLDDNGYVTENTHVQMGLTRASVVWAFTTPYAANWHPLTWLSLMLDVQLFGVDAGRMHVTSLLLHVLNALLLLLLLVWMTGALWRSALVAALFALHPLHVESVVWISERKDVLSTLFWLSTLFAWVAYARSKRIGPYLLALVLYALGLMTKPMLVTLPFTLLLLDYWPLRRIDLPIGGKGPVLRGLVTEKIPFFVLTAASCVVTFVAQRAGGAVRPLENLSLAGRVGNSLWAYGAYLWKTLFPTRLAIFYPLPPEGHPAWQVALAGLLLLGFSAGALRLAARAPHLLFGWLWFVGTLVPVIGIVQVGDQAMADRYTYVPLIGLFVAAVWSLGEWGGRSRPARAATTCAAVALLLALSAATHVQVGYWSDSKKLFERVLSVTSNNYLIATNLGALVLEEGRTDEAIAHFREAIRVRPTYDLAHDDLGLALVKAGKLEEAISHFQEAIRIKPDSAQAHDDLGMALTKAGRLEEALAHFRQAREGKPDDAGLDARTAMVLVKLDRIPEAEELLERAIRVGADTFDAHCALGTALQLVGRLPEAAEHCNRALEMKPDSPLALTCVGQALGRMGRQAEACASLEKAAKLDPDRVSARINLGVALDRAGRLPEALEQFEAALRLDPTSAWGAFQMGLALGKLNRLQEAANSFEKAVRLDPGYADAWANRGTALVQLNRPGEAIACLQKAVALAPRRVEMRINLGKVLDYAGRTTEARGQLGEALRIRPDHPQARAAMEEFTRAHREAR